MPHVNKQRPRKTIDNALEIMTMITMKMMIMMMMMMMMMLVNVNSCLRDNNCCVLLPLSGNSDI